MSLELPAYLEVALIAKANNMSTEKTRRKLHRAGILEPDGPHRYHVAESRLRERLSDMHERVYSYLVRQAESRTEARRQA